MPGETSAGSVLAVLGWTVKCNGNKHLQACNKKCTISHPCGLDNCHVACNAIVLTCILPLKQMIIRNSRLQPRAPALMQVIKHNTLR